MTKKTEEEVIQYLPFPDCIRKRVGMYLGDVSSADICLREIVDNSTDEAAAGYGDTIIISNDFNGFMYVSDNGRGIPISLSADKPGLTQAYLSISDLHTGSKFSSTSNSRVGMNGIGSSSVNACSDIYILMSRITEDNYNRSIPEVKTLWESSGPRSKRDLFYVVVCEKGIKVYEGANRLKDIEKRLFSGDHIPIPEGQSTIVMFKPDGTIFESTKAAIPVINLQYFLLIQSKFFDRRIGILANGEKLGNTIKPLKFEVVKTVKPKDTSKNKEVSMYITFEYDPGMGNKATCGSVNGLEVNNGQHVTIAESCIKAALKDLYKIKHDYLLNGLQMRVILLASDVVFSEQIKSNLRSISKVKVTDFVDLVKEIEKVMKKNQAYFDSVVAKLNKLSESMKDLGASELAEKFMEGTSGVGLYRNKLSLVPGFVEATGRDRTKCELFITEGNSAAGSLVAARPDTTRFAVLPLRGKILNVTNASVKRAMESQVIYTIFSVIGLGLDINNVVKDCKTREEAVEVIKQKSRYGKIIIATDADADGSAIANELLHMFGKYASFMIELGLIYRAISPLWKGKSRTTGRITYYYPGDQYNKDTGFPLDMDEKAHYSRYKGLGSLSPETGEVEDIFFSEGTRKIIKITPDGLNYAMSLNEDIVERKKLLTNRGILTNPYNFKN